MTSTDRLATATARMERAGLWLSKAETDLQRARTLGYWGTIIEVYENKVASAKLVMTACYEARKQILNG